MELRKQFHLNIICQLMVSAYIDAHKELGDLWLPFFFSRAIIKESKFQSSYQLRLILFLTTFTKSFYLFYTVLSSNQRYNTSNPSQESKLQWSLLWGFSYVRFGNMCSILVFVIFHTPTDVFAIKDFLKCETKQELLCVPVITPCVKYRGGVLTRDGVEKSFHALKWQSGRVLNN